MKKIISFVCIAVLTYILLSAAAVSVAAFDVTEQFTYAEYEYEDTYINYRLYVPEDYDGVTAYPIVLFLHGAGERGDDNTAQLKNVLPVLFADDNSPLREAIVIAPQCLNDEQWVDTPWIDGNYSVDEVPESDNLKAVLSLIESIKSVYTVDNNRIYAIGLSMGGFGVWDLLIRHNDIFAAGIPMCGGGDPSKADILAQTPIYTFHGTADSTVPYEATADMVSAIEDTGSRLINFVSYEGEGHDIWDKASAEDGLCDWLFAQNLSARYGETTETEIETTEPTTTELFIAPPEITETEEIAAEKDGGINSIYIYIAIAAAVAAIAVVCVVLLKKKSLKADSKTAESKDIDAENESNSDKESKN